MEGKEIRESLLFFYDLSPDCEFLKGKDHILLSLHFQAQHSTWYITGREDSVQLPGGWVDLCCMDRRMGGPRDGKNIKR